MKASVIIPLAGQEKPLKRCISSVLAQTFSDYEIIFIDDCSDGGGLKVATKLLANYQYAKIIIHEHRQGLWPTRCDGINQAIGEYTLFVDPREWIAPDALEILITTADDFRTDLVQMKRRRTVQQKYICPPPALDFSLPYGTRIEGEELRSITQYNGLNSPITPYCGDKLYRTSILKTVAREKCNVNWGEVQIMNIHYMRHARSMVMINNAGVYEDWSASPEHYRFSRLDDYKKLYDIKKILCKDQEPLKRELRTLLHQHVNELLGEMAWTPEAVALFFHDELEKPIWKEVGVTPDINAIIASEMKVLKHNFWKNTIRRFLTQ